MPEDELIKEKILSHCQERFFKEGFVRITVDELAADLAISKKTFYKYFSSKEDVVQQIMERFMGTVRGNVERILLSDKSAVEKLSEIITMLASNINRVSPIYGQDIKRRLPEFWKHIEEFRRKRLSDAFERLINQGISEGTMRPEMNKRVFLMSVIGAIERIVQPEVLTQESFSIGEAVSEIISIFFIGAVTAQGRQQFEQLRLTPINSF
ncbi:MAG: TetR/AcrR family transcriptional regulator [Bacteroidetes bacterium]|nr:TetR/AcrR family transcriptional regulator [Bacteroidota bacterium]MCW5895257.1 TetR/AcrR family transcriptional regulator [Bacteroidota bacterium]